VNNKNKLTRKTLDEWREPLIAAARVAMTGSYSPYSSFPVGAALLTTGGVMFSGANVENLSFGLTICAERVAAAAAVVAGAREWLAIAVVADTDVPITPCGACRQFLAEFAPDLVIWSSDRDGQILEAHLGVLLPRSRAGILNLGEGQ